MTESVQNADTIWVNTEPAGDSYAVTIQIGPDFAFSPADPPRYALAVIAAIGRAMFESAVARQMREVCGPDPEKVRTGVMLALGELREAHTPLDSEATFPLLFSPVVAGDPARDFAPSVHISLDGMKFCQWDNADAYSHATAVLGCHVVAPLDALYSRILRDEFGMNTEGSYAAVGDLRRYRDDAD